MNRLNVHLFTPRVTVVKNQHRMRGVVTIVTEECDHHHQEPVAAEAEPGCAVEVLRPSNSQLDLRRAGRRETPCNLRTSATRLLLGRRVLVVPAILVLTLDQEQAVRTAFRWRRNCNVCRSEPRGRANPSQRRSLRIRPSARKIADRLPGRFHFKRRIWVGASVARSIRVHRSPLREAGNSAS